MTRVLFVCLGSICRSPTAEAVMARLVADAGLQERVALRQLAPLLLNAALFGPSWGERATNVLRRYA